MPEPEMDDVLELTNVVDKPPPVMAEEPRRLMSDETARQASDALSGLQARVPRNLLLGNSDLTVEDLVRAELRPILKAWLDQYLPDLVERMVQREIRRITRESQDY
jgi:cell pole-organizing protein PopZ